MGASVPNLGWLVELIEIQTGYLCFPNVWLNTLHTTEVYLGPCKGLAFFPKQLMVFSYWLILQKSSIIDAWKVPKYAYSRTKYDFDMKFVPNSKQNKTNMITSENTTVTSSWQLIKFDVLLSTGLGAVRRSDYGKIRYSLLQPIFSIFYYLNRTENRAGKY